MAIPNYLIAKSLVFLNTYSVTYKPFSKPREGKYNVFECIFMFILNNHDELARLA